MTDPYRITSTFEFGFAFSVALVASRTAVARRRGGLLRRAEVDGDSTAKQIKALEAINRKDQRKGGWFSGGKHEEELLAALTAERKTTTRLRAQLEAKEKDTAAKLDAMAEQLREYEGRELALLARAEAAEEQSWKSSTVKLPDELAEQLKQTQRVAEELSETIRKTLDAAEIWQSRQLVLTEDYDGGHESMRPATDDDSDSEDEDSKFAPILEEQNAALRKMLSVISKLERPEN